MTDRLQSTRKRAARRAALFAFSFGLLGLSAGALHARMAQDVLTLVTGTSERRIDIEVAEAPDDMALGLMYRTELADGRGMLFPSPAPREVSMWMRNTYIPLDMVFIRADGVIHRIEAMTEPLSETIVASNGPVLAVLELAGGAAARFGLKPGDKVRYRLFGNAR
jgi:uncharacterized protein